MIPAFDRDIGHGRFPLITVLELAIGRGAAILVWYGSRGFDKGDKLIR